VLRLRGKEQVGESVGVRREGEVAEDGKSAEKRHEDLRGWRPIDLCRAGTSVDELEGEGL